jgi:long-chain acyl-CoA synthetase
MGEAATAGPASSSACYFRAMAGQSKAAGWLRPYDESGTAVTQAGDHLFRWIPASVPALFADLAEMRPDADAVVDLGRPGERDGSLAGVRLSYARLWERVRRVAGGFAARGVLPGERIAIRLPNGADWCLAFLGAQAAGAVAVPVNTRFTRAEAGFVVGDCGAKIVIGPGDELPDGPPLARQCDPDIPGALFYTSGTTGRLKGAMLTHRAMLSAAESARRALELSRLPESAIRSLVPAPLFHAVGSLVQWLSTSLAAGTTVLMPEFDAGEWLRAIEAERISVLTAVPSRYWLAMRRPEFAVTDLSSVHRVGYGAAPTPPARVSQLTKAFPTAKLCPGYGLTETAGIVSGLPHDYALSHADTVGFAMPATDIALGSVGPDGSGELLVRGPQLMSGYWNRPEATARALSGGWLHTGDIAQITRDGAIRLRYISVRPDPFPRHAGGKVIKPLLGDETPWGNPLW